MKKIAIILLFASMLFVGGANYAKAGLDNFGQYISGIDNISDRQDAAKTHGKIRPDSY